MVTLTATLRPGREGWPSSLDRLPDPPGCIRVAGHLPENMPYVSVVGTRNADEEALDFARELARTLSRSGCAVVSGGARGIDGAAHVGALEAGGPTVAVLAGGFRNPYPPEHGSLFEWIAAKGALLTEFEDRVPPRAGRFLQRNRIVAALSDVVVVVQAPRRSGALSTARHALKLDCPVMAVPAAPWDPRGAGCSKLLSDGARPCRSASDVLAVLGCPSRSMELEAALPLVEWTETPILSVDEKTVLHAIGGRPRHPDELARKTSLPIGRVHRVLLTLLISGQVRLREGGRYARAVRRSA